nr:DUF362 domain-containing protein [Desulfobacterales bacterium]
KVSGTPAKYDQQAVDEVKGMLKEGVDYLGGMKKFVKPNDVVLLKVNAVFGVPADAAWDTDPRVVEALVTLIKEEVPGVRKIIVADSSASTKQDPKMDSVEAMETAGIAQAARRAGAEVLCLEYDAHVRVTIPGARALPYFDLPKVIDDADVFISLPKWKNHVECRMTLGIKNAQGYYGRILVPDKTGTSVTGFITDPMGDKERCHANDLHQKFVDTLKVVYPDLTIIDGLWALQGDGPGVAHDWEVIRDMNMIVMSDDVVAADSVAAQASGYAWDWVITTRLAAQQGFGHGRPEEIEIKGADLDKVMVRFIPPGLYDIQGFFPNVDVYMHGACAHGCPALVRMFFNFLEADGTLAKLKEPINIIIGNDTYIPPHLKPERTCLLGDCVWYEGTYKFCKEQGSLTPKELADRGALVSPGCPSFPNFYNQVMPWVSKVAERDQAELEAEAEAKAEDKE